MVGGRSFTRRAIRRIQGLPDPRRDGTPAPYSPYIPGEFRRPNVYTNLPFYDPAALDARFRAMEGTYGKEALDRARSIAALVYDDSDAAAVERFIVFERKYGTERMNEALKILGDKKGDNPKRSTAYLFGVLDGMEREAGE